MVRDPKLFFRGCSKPVVVFDEKKFRDTLNTSCARAAAGSKSRKPPRRSASRGPRWKAMCARWKSPTPSHWCGPSTGGGQHELVKQPKLYAFDTGFASFARGWDPFRPDDFGILWEHIVLEHLQAHFPDTPIRYWRDKGGREVDFVFAQRRNEVDVIECKWDARAFDSMALKVFRSYYPKGRNYLITPSAETAYTRSYGELKVTICTPTQLRPSPSPAPEIP